MNYIKNLSDLASYVSGYDKLQISLPGFSCSYNHITDWASISLVPNVIDL